MYNLAHSLEGQHRNPVFAYLPCKLPEAVQGGVLSINSMSVEQTSSVCSGRPRPSYRVATALPAAVDMAVGSSVFRFGSAVSRRRPALDALNAKPKSPESKSSCANQWRSRRVGVRVRRRWGRPAGLYSPGATGCVSNRPKALALRPRAPARLVRVPERLTGARQIRAPR